MALHRELTRDDALTSEGYAEFVRRIRSGDWAAAELVWRCEPEIRLEVRTWLRLRDPRLRRVLDSVDICRPDDRMAATGSEDGRAQLWRVPSQPRPGTLEEVRPWVEIATGQELTDDPIGVRALIPEAQHERQASRERERPDDSSPLRLLTLPARSREVFRMRCNLRAIALAFVAVLAPVPALSSGEPRLVSTDPAELAARKARLTTGAGDLRAAFDRLVRAADEALRQRPLSVRDRKRSVAGAGPHDYVSFAPYFWPNPDAADGLPYIRIDGRHNRELVAQGDRVHFGDIKEAVSTLALAYYFTGNARYAEHAARLLRAWFLDPATRMNPHLEHAQAVPGGPTGRPVGLIEFRDMPQLVDALAILETAPAWTPADRKAMRAWLTEYYAWLTTSRLGRGEANATNNHGCWYDVQALALAVYLGKDRDARLIAERFGPERIAVQVRPDGSQPRELGRVNSWGYSVFNVAAMLSVAEMGERVGVDLWKFRTDDGRSLRAALGYLTPYLDRQRKWPSGPGHPAKPEELVGPLIRAARGLGTEPYQKLLETLPRSAWEDHRDRLLHGRLLRTP